VLREKGCWIADAGDAVKLADLAEAVLGGRVPLVIARAAARSSQRNPAAFRLDPLPQIAIRAHAFHFCILVDRNS